MRVNRRLPSNTYVLMRFHKIKHLKIVWHCQVMQLLQQCILYACYHCFAVPKDIILELVNKLRHIFPSRSCLGGAGIFNFGIGGL